MLHKQQLPDAEYQDLRRVYLVMICFLRWLLLKANGIHLDNKAEFEQKFGRPLGRWFYNRIWNKSHIQTGFGEKVANLLDLTQADHDQAFIAAGYLLNDIRFYKNWDKQGYGLKFPLLSEEWKKVIRDVCIPYLRKLV